jgi:hypothetical protein
MEKEFKASKFHNIIVFVFVFLCFFPYPALSIGQTTGLQLGLLFLLLLSPPLMVRRISSKYFYIFMLLTLPVLLSLSIHLISGSYVSDAIMIKSSVSYALVAIFIFLSGFIMKGALMETIINAVSYAIMVHFLVGLLQMLSFIKGSEFPFLFLYHTNPSFTSLPTANDVYVYVNYVKRPFGIFPEPSAMSASIGPWILMMLYICFSVKPELGRKTKVIMSFATFGGLILVFLSKSGYIYGLIFSLLLLLMLFIIRNQNFKSSIKLISIVFILSAFVISALFIFRLPYFSRLDFIQNSSWQSRLRSLQAGFKFILTDPMSLLFGVGPGQSFLIFKREFTISSVLVNYVTENGIIGLISFLGILIILIVSSAERSFKIVLIFSWLFGIVFTTSYPLLLPLWLFPSILLSWRNINIGHINAGK